MLSHLTSLHYLAAWLAAFAFTQVVEVPIYRWLLRVRAGPAFGASALTHPFVWFVFPAVGWTFDLPYVLVAILAELFAWLVEAAYFVGLGRRATAPFGRARFTLKWTLLASFVANGASVTLGLASRALFGVP